MPLLTGLMMSLMTLLFLPGQAAKALVDVAQHSRYNIPDTVKGTRHIYIIHYAHNILHVAYVSVHRLSLILII